MSKKFLIFIGLIFIISMGSISAQDVTDDTLVINENQDMDMLSTVEDDNIETGDVLQEANHARFDIKNDTANWEISVLDDNDNYVTEGIVEISLEKSKLNILYDEFSDYYYHTSVNLYTYYEYFPDNLLISYRGNYQVDNISVPVDLVDSIVAKDIVDEFSFSATLYDSKGVPLKGEEVYFHVYYEDYSYYKSFYSMTDVNGVASIDPPLYIGNYVVEINNRGTGQYKCYSWNITKMDDSKFVEIKASQVANKLVVSAVDCDGNNLTEGKFIFTAENGIFIEKVLGWEFFDNFVVLNLYGFDFDEFPQNISIYFENDAYYPATDSIFVDSLIDTIDGEDIVGEPVFSVTCYDEYGTALNSEHVYINIENQDHSYSDYFYEMTDENGVVSINPALPIGNYSVLVTNTVTNQHKKYWWNITQIYPSKVSWINATLDGYFIRVNVLNLTNDTIDGGDLSISVDGSSHDTIYEHKYPIYIWGKGTHNVTVYYEDYNYYDSNTSLTVDLNDTIIINESFYNTTNISFQIVDYNGNPVNNTEFSISTENIWFEGYTDENGNFTYDLSLWPGKYVVSIYNKVSQQSKDVSIEILEEYESKKALINVTNDGYKFTINVSDINGNKIDNGRIRVHSNYFTYFVTINNGTAIFILSGDTVYDLESINLTFMLDHSNYYPVNTTIEFETVDTINSTYVYGKSRFEATFFDMDMNPLVNKEVLFSLYYYSYYISDLIENITVITDENGLAFIEKTKPLAYRVLSTNLVTHQSENNYWWDKEIDITPIVDYIDNSTGKLYISNNTLTFKVSPNATGNISIFDQRTSEYWIKKIENESISIILPSFGEYSLKLKCPGNGYYDYTEVDYVVVYYQKYTPNMTVSQDLNIDYLDDANFTVNLKYGENPIINASIEIKIGNDTHDFVTDEQGNVIIPIVLDAGIYNVNVNYLGNRTYYPVNKTALLTVNKIKPTISINDTVIDYGEKLYVNIDINATGKITVEINGKKYESTIDNSVAVIDLSELVKGTYNSKIIYSGDNNYYNSTIDGKITINPVKIDNFNVTAESITEGEAAKIEMQLPKDATGNVTASVNGKEYMVPVENGSATIIIPDLAKGNYSIPISYSGDEKYDSLTANASLIVKEDTSDIIRAPNLVKYYGGSERFFVYVTDYKGNPLANKTVKISINGENYYRTTNQNGSADMAIRLSSGVFNATVTLDNKTIDSVITILPTVNGTDIVKIFRNGTQYYATFRDSEGNYLKDGEVVRFNINGVMYDRTVSGGKGLASLNINLRQGEYIITAMNLVTGENSGNIITVIPRIVENYDLTKYYRNASQYTVKVLGDDGKAVGAGEEVTFNINGIFYTRTTDESGIAKLNINLQQGDYIITAIYGECMVSNNIKVLPVLSASDLTKKYGTPDQFVATLVDGQGNPYNNQKIQFNINGVFYYRITDSEGQAKLNINLQAGQYIITSSYNESSIGNTVTVTA